MVKVFLFVLVALLSLPAAEFLAGVYQGIGFESAKPSGVMWGFFWTALWFAMKPLSRPS